jgi:uncharacterized surface protein with fasciclin (FAS1) repeats
MEIEATVPATSVDIGSGHGHKGWNEQVAVGFTATALASAKTDDGVSQGFTATQVAFKDSLATAYQIEGRALLEAAKNQNLLAVQATNNFNLVQIEAVKNAAAAQLTATVNAAAIAAQLAECCCELKEKIGADGDATRALINTNTIESLREKLIATVRLVPAGVPVGT